MTRECFWISVISYCLLTGGSTTSGFRTNARNLLVKGVKHSPHRYGFGEDVVFDADLSPDERETIARNADTPVLFIWKPDNATRIEMAARLGLRLVIEGDHDHLQPLEWSPG